MRKVIVLKWTQVEIDGCRTHVKVEKCRATFHQFGSGYEEFESGAGNYSTAIVEHTDGSVENVPVELIKFID